MIGGLKLFLYHNIEGLIHLESAVCNTILYTGLIFLDNAVYDTVFGRLNIS